MEDRFYTATEIMALCLPGLPTSKQALLARAQKEKWISSVGTGRGGTHKLFRIPFHYRAGLHACVREGAARYAPDTTVLWDMSHHEQALTWSQWAASIDKDLAVPVLYAPTGVAGKTILHYAPGHAANAMRIDRALLQQLGVKPHQVFYLGICGDAMTPTLPDGSLVLVDTHQRQIAEGVFVIRRGQDLMVKRLQPIGAGMIRVKSDNPAYDDFDVDPTTEDTTGFEIVGKVIQLSSTEI